jgi:hypothetical protein
VEAAARILHHAGLRHDWWGKYKKSYEELAATDEIGRSEFDAIVESMLVAAAQFRGGGASNLFHSDPKSGHAVVRVGGAAKGQERSSSLFLASPSDPFGQAHLDGIIIMLYDDPVT